MSSFQRWFDFSAINEDGGNERIIEQEREHQVLQRLHAVSYLVNADVHKSMLLSFIILQNYALREGTSQHFFLCTAFTSVGKERCCLWTRCFFGVSLYGLGDMSNVVYFNKIQSNPIK